MTSQKVTIVGGGLAGLVTLIDLTRRGIRARLVEKQSYPVHRVCGEYVSNEVVPYLTSLDAYPAALNPARISRLQLSSTKGESVELPLDLGGFGVSRHGFDHFLWKVATGMGAEVITNSEVTEIKFRDNAFLLTSGHETWDSDVVIGCFGKRSRLDVTMNRAFVQQRSPYVGVKYHIRLSEFPDDVIALHNFEKGYCGMSRVENGVVNLCYLTHRENLREAGNIRTMEEKVLFRNPFIKRTFETATFIFEKPETINEISFETKNPVENHILMAGDSAGMIAPFCGNGMAMAIHGAKVVSECVSRFCSDASYSRNQMEADYTRTWRQNFSGRLWAGRKIQQLFGGDWASRFAVTLAKRARPIARYLVTKTHGKVI